MSKTRAWSAWVTLFASMTGCASLQSATSGQIGCPASDITITDDDPGWSTRTWTAECHGKRYFCSAVATGKDNSQVSCKESNEESASANESKPAVPAGCQYDAQCKGTRVCKEGRCVDQ